MTNPRVTHDASTSVLVQAPLAAVWQALTDPTIVKRYFFDTDLVTDWKVGSPLFFRGTYDGKTYEDRGTVLAFDPPRALSFDYWSSMSGLEDRPELRQIVTYALGERDSATEVTVRQSNVDTKERAQHSVDNWKVVLEAMKKLLEDG